MFANVQVAVLARQGRSRELLRPAARFGVEERIAALKAAGLTVLLAEQNVHAVLCLADRGYVIDDGRIRYAGTVAHLRANDEVRRRYLLE